MHRNSRKLRQNCAYVLQCKFNKNDYHNELELFVLTEFEYTVSQKNKTPNSCP